MHNTWSNILHCFGLKEPSSGNTMLDANTNSMINSTKGLTLCTQKWFTRHHLLMQKLKLSVWGQSDKHCLASPRTCQQFNLLRQCVTKLIRYSYRQYSRVEVCSTATTPHVIWCICTYMCTYMCTCVYTCRSVGIALVNTPQLFIQTGQAIAVMICVFKLRGNGKFIVCLTRANVCESMGKPCSCRQFIKSRLFYYKSRENPYQVL